MKKKNLLEWQSLGMGEERVGSGKEMEIRKGPRQKKVTSS